MRGRDREPSLLRAIRGPITLITVGVLFALNNFTQYSFDKTWPVLLIVFGLLSLLREWAEHTHDAPIIHDQGPIFHDQAADYRGSRSQFAWQSRSHFRAPD